MGHAHHFVYRTTCKATGRIYVGMHSTNDLEDGYLGGGVWLNRAITKYGKDNFSREILSFHETRELASLEEGRIVTQEFVDDPTNFNLRLGGENARMPRPTSLHMKMGWSAGAEKGKHTEFLKGAADARWAQEGSKEHMSSVATSLWATDSFRLDMRWKQRMVQGYWGVWRDARRIYDRWVEMGGETPYPSGMPKRGSGYKAIGKWYVQHAVDMVGDETVFHNMVDMFKFEGWNPHTDEVYLKMLNSSVSKSMVVVRGSSGTGKGTRVCQFLTYLQEKGHHWEEVKFEWEGKERTFGTFFPDLKIMFIGMFTRSNKSNLTSWTSMDYIHALVSKTEKARHLLSSMWTDPQVTFVVEGEPLMASDKWRPLFLQPFHKLKRFLFLTFMYTDREEYDERIVGRSGKVAGEAGWSRNVGYESEWRRTSEELMELGMVASDVDHEAFIDPKTGHVSFNRMLPHDAPLSAVGDSIMEFLGLDCLDPLDFSRDCRERPVLRRIGETDPLAGRVPEKQPKQPKQPKLKEPAPSTTRSVFDLF